MNEDAAALEDFGGTARLFPLPNLVFFPHSLQPLHVFEPRYRQMTADALAADKLIALVLLQPGWEKSYEQRPPVHRVACLGRIVADQMLPDGRYNLLLRGLSRVRIEEEITVPKLYRAARVELLPDRHAVPLESVMALRERLAKHILPRFKGTAIAKQLHDLFHSELSLGALCDVLAFALPIPVELKQGLLEEPDEDVRANQLLEGFETFVPKAVAAGDRKFPPDFSSN
jgi:Lon protease-like protein